MYNSDCSTDRLISEFDKLAHELSRLPRSIQVTGIELRFAMLRSMVEAAFNSSDGKVADIQIEADRQTRQKEMPPALPQWTVGHRKIRSWT